MAQASVEAHHSAADSARRFPDYRLLIIIAAVGVVLYFLYRYTFDVMYGVWDRPDSYYSHGPLVPIISLGFVFLKRKELLATPLRPSLLGFPVLAGSCVMLLLGDFLGFNVVVQLSFIPMLAGLVLALMGWAHLKLLWFPIAFLIFMIPVPSSLVQSVQLRIKLAATEASVALARVLGFAMIRDGSFVYFKDDMLLVGDVCGGLRSLIALLSFGAIMAYVSKTQWWARILMLLLSAPVAIIANISRIFLLCVVGYWYGSETAAGTVHDVSGYAIYAVALILLILLEMLLRKIAPKREAQEEST
jgi:exosortase